MPPADTDLMAIEPEGSDRRPDSAGPGRSVFEASPEELGAWMTERGHRPYHARQVYRWVFERRAEGFEGMSDVPKRLRDELQEHWSIFSTRVSTHQVAPDGTDKLLLECRDGRRIECVLMAEQERRTVCI